MQALDFAGVARLLKSASNYLDVFGDCNPPLERELKTRYRSLVKVIHPDRVDVSLQHEASLLVDRLTRLYNTALDMAKTDRFGKVTSELSITTRLATHGDLAEAFQFADMTNVYKAATTLRSGGQMTTVVKLARVPRDNELLKAERAVLRTLQSTGAEHAMYYPKLVDGFVVADGRKRLEGNVLEFMEDFLNLSELKQRVPTGLDPLHVAWIWRRVLWALGGAHEHGLVHGAVLPAHIIIHPRMHGVLLVDWCYSRSSEDNDYGPLKAMVAKYQSWYPPSVFAKKPVSPELDLVMAARTMVYLLGGDPVSMNMPGSVPGHMQRYFIRIVAGRTSSAYELLGQFDGVLQQLGAPYFPRKYRELILD